jgi:hypothetical protein
VEPKAKNLKIHQYKNMPNESESLVSLVQSEIPPEQHTLVKGRSVECKFARDHDVVIKFGGSVLHGKFLEATGFKDTCKVRVSGRDYTVDLAEVQDKAEHDTQKQVGKITETVKDYADLIAAWSLGIRGDQNLSDATATHIRWIPKQVAKLQSLNLISKI